MKRMQTLADLIWMSTRYAPIWTAYVGERQEWTNLRGSARQILSPQLGKDEAR